MWCDRVIRNIAEARRERCSGRADRLRRSGMAPIRPALKARSRGGEEIRIVLGAGARLRHGDVIFEDESRLVAVNVKACELIVVRPGDSKIAAILALELGNLHWPTQIAESEIIFREAPQTLAILEKLNVHGTKETRRFQPSDVIGGPMARLSNSLQVIRGVSPRNSIKSA